VPGRGFRIDYQVPLIVRPVLDTHWRAALEFNVQGLDERAGRCGAVRAHARRFHAEHRGTTRDREHQDNESAVHAIAAAA
jgi:hypothetical protein